MIRLGLLAVIAVVATTLVYGLSLALASLADGWCGNTVVQRLPSPDGARVAVLFQRNCGATTDFSSQVSLLGSDESLPNVSGNLFIAQPGKLGERAAWGGPPVRLRWLDAGTLLIRHDPAAQVALATAEHGGTRIVVEAGE